MKTLLLSVLLFQLALKIFFNVFIILQAWPYV